MHRYNCSKCRTEYVSPGECDWCPGERRQLMFIGDCKIALEQAYVYIRKLELKARRFDATVLAAYRMGGPCSDVIKSVIERIRS
jgi:hypothetical protein